MRGIYFKKEKRKSMGLLVQNFLSITIWFKSFKSSQRYNIQTHAKKKSLSMAKVRYKNDTSKTKIHFSYITRTTMNKYNIDTMYRLKPQNPSTDRC